FDPSIYVLEGRPAASAAGAPKRDLVLLVSTPQARPGFDTAQIAYVRQAHELDYFAKSRWADTPSRMLAPLLAQALEQTRGFQSVVESASAVASDLRLDTELIRLQQDFATTPSQVRLTLRAQLVDVRGRRVIAAREFDEVESAPNENAYGGVIAANRALQRVLKQLADFCVAGSPSR
ncbi:MAG: ABC-type transport auxiliary lipoprotein family protein, partial [Burkholderiales bacterium]